MRRKRKACASAVLRRGFLGNNVSELGERVTLVQDDIAFHRFVRADVLGPPPKWDAAALRDVLLIVPNL